jgi:hypothetical protein
MADIITSRTLLRRSPTLAETAKLVTFVAPEEASTSLERSSTRRAAWCWIDDDDTAGVIAGKEDLAPPHDLLAQAFIQVSG